MTCIHFSLPSVVSVILLSTCITTSLTLSLRLIVIHYSNPAVCSHQSVHLSNWTAGPRSELWTTCLSAVSFSQFESFKRRIVRTSCSVLIIARVCWWIKIRICDLNKGYGYFLWICGSRNGKSWEGILWLLTESLLGSSVCQWDYTKNHWGSFHKSSGDLEQSNKTWTTFFKTAKRSFLAALAEDALLPSRCALFEWIVPPPCRGVKLNFTEGHNEKWQSHPDPNTSGFNSFTCHTPQKSDQTVNRKSETLTQLTCRPHVCLKSGMSNQLPTLALSGSICKDIYLHIESFSYLHIYKAKCRLNTMSQLFSRW